MRIRVLGQVPAADGDIHQSAQIKVYDIKCDVDTALICEGDAVKLVGRWMLVHVGSAMSIINEDEVKVTLDTFCHMEYDITSTR